MSWTIKFTPRADKAFSKLDQKNQKRILSKLEDISSLENPQSTGKALTGKLAGLWCYRIEDYRVLCSIKGSEIISLVVDLGHRRDIYNN